MATSVIDGAHDAITAGAIGGKGKGKIRPPPPPKAKAKPKAEGYTSQPQALQTCRLHFCIQLFRAVLPRRAALQGAIDQRKMPPLPKPAADEAQPDLRFVFVTLRRSVSRPGSSETCFV